MSHTAKNPTLGRQAAPRKALLISQSNALIKHKRIVTTIAKAKALARFVAPIITKARNRSLKDFNHAHLLAFHTLRDKKSVHVLFNDVVPKVQERPGGYTRVIKLSQTRKGDSAQQALIELVDYNTLFKKAKKGKRKRQKASSKNIAKGSATNQENQQELPKSNPRISSSR